MSRPVLSNMYGNPETTLIKNSLLEIMTVTGFILRGRIIDWSLVYSLISWLEAPAPAQCSSCVYSDLRWMAGKFNIESRSLKFREAQIIEQSYTKFIHSRPLQNKTKVVHCIVQLYYIDDSIIFAKMLIFASYLDHLWFHFAMDF